jgi:PHD/YefM family antitoxin component YafN of YafNO toxin-antitoxin module
MAADDLESLQETVFRLSKPGIRQSVAAAEEDYAAGTTIGGADLRAEFGLPPR